MANKKHVFDFESLLSAKIDQQNWKQAIKALREQFGEFKISLDSGDAEKEAKKHVDTLNKIFAKAEMPEIGLDDLKKNFDAITQSVEKALALINNIDTSALKGIETSLDHISDQVDKIVNNIGKDVSKATKSAVASVNKLDAVLAKVGDQTKEINEALNFSGTDGTKKQASVLKELSTQYEAFEARRRAAAEKGEAEDAQNWVNRQQAMIKYIRAYEEYLKTLKNPKSAKKEYTEMYNKLLPRSHDARTNLQNLVDRRSGAYSSNTEPWAKEQTLKEVRDILKNGIKVSGDEKPKSDNSTPSKYNPKQHGVTTPKDEKWVTLYRGIHAPEDEDDVLTTRNEYISRSGGAEPWSTKRGVAETYAVDFDDSAVLMGRALPKNPLIIDAGKHTFKEFDKMPGIKEIFPEIIDKLNGGVFNAKTGADDIQSYINSRAKEMGYDDVVMHNVYDSNNERSDNVLSDVHFIIDDAILQVKGSYARTPNDEIDFSTSRGEVPKYYKMPNAEAEVSTPPLTNAYNKAPDELKKKYQEIIALQDQIDEFENKTQKTPIDIDPWNATKEQKDQIVAAWREYQKVIQEIASMPVVETEDDEKRLLELKAKAVSLYETMRQGHLNDVLGDGYAKEYGLSIKDGKQMHLDMQDEPRKDFDKSLGGLRSKLNDAYLAAQKLDVEMYKMMLHADDDSIENLYEKIRHDALAAQSAVTGLNNELQATGDKSDSVDGKLGDGVLAGAGQPVGATTEEVANLEAIRAKVAEITTAVEAKTNAFKTEGAEVSNVVDGEIAKLGELENKVTAVKTTLEGLLNNIKTGADDVGTGLGNITVNVNHQNDEEEKGVSIDKESLKQALGEVIYKVKIAHDDNDKQANKIAIDESTLEAVLKRVFTKELAPQAEQPKTEPKKETSAIEKTLLGIKETLGQVQANTAKIEPQQSINNVENALSAIKTATESVDKKIVRGTKTVIGGEDVDAKKKSKTVEGRDAQILAERIETQKLALKKFKTELTTSGKMTDDVAKKIRGLAISLGMVKDSKGLTRWGEKFKQQKLGVGITDIEGKEEKQLEKDLLKEQETRLKTLNKLYQEYGVLVERAGAATGNFGEQLKDEVVAKEDEIIKLFDLVGDLTPEMANGFDEAFDRGRNIESTKQYEALAKKSDADEATRLKNIANLEKEIGKLRADVDVATNVGVRNALEEEIQLREKLIELQKQGLEMEAQDEAYYRQATANRTKQAKAEATQEIKERKDVFKQAEKDEKKRLSDEKRLAKKQAMTGKAGSAISKAEGVWLEAEGLDQAKLPDGFKEQVSEYYDALDKLRLKHHEVNTSKVVTEEQQAELIRQTKEVNKLTEAVGPLVAEYQKLSGTNVDEANSRATTLTGTSSLNDYEMQLKQYVKSITDGKGQIKSFNAETKTLTYTVKTGKNEFTEYTAAVRHLDHQMVAVQGTTKRTETFLEATKRKMKELTSYMSGMALFSRIGQELRRGIQYVREIDLALTELKKVTDETEETYDRFLETAAKTADKVGSTIQKVVSSTADWARLGSILAKTNIRPVM